MLSFKISTTIILLTIARIECSGLHPVLHTPAINYVKSIPYNVPPFAASVNVFNRFVSPIPRPILHSPPLLTAAPVVPQLPYLPLPYPQARSIHPPSVVTRDFYPGHVAIPGALPGPLPLPATYAGPLPLPGPLPLSGPHPLPGGYAGSFPLPGPLPLSGPGLYPGPLSLAGSPHLPGPLPYPAQVPVAEPLPHSVIADSLNPGFPTFPNVNPYATPYGPPNNVLAPPLLKK